jgi:colanic acid/amylovoran biosynthesis glycosyltransferase
MLPHEEYRAAMRRAHVCIQPSRTAADGDSEGGAPTVLLEMQAAGIPVVATRHADIPNVVADPDALVEEEDVDGLAAALVRLAGLSEDDWRTLAEHGRALVEAEHDARSVAGQVEALYGELSGAGA